MTHESVTVPVGRDRKIRTALRTNQIAIFVTVTSEKKIKVQIQPTLLTASPSSFLKLPVENVKAGSKRNGGRERKKARK